MFTSSERLANHLKINEIGEARKLVRKHEMGDTESGKLVKKNEMVMRGSRSVVHKQDNL